MDALKPFLTTISSGMTLSAAEATQAFETILAGEATPAQIGAFLMALRVRGETVEEITAGAQVMRRHALAVKAPDHALDTCGTGGDGTGTYNISTATAFVVAGAGVPVAKHGNRNLSSKSGAADALGQMGVEVMVGAEVVERALAEVGCVDMIVDEFGLVAFRVFAHLIHQPRALDHIGKTGIVLHICCYGQLSSWLRTLYQRWLQHRPCCVYGRSIPRGS